MNKTGVILLRQRAKGAWEKYQETGNRAEYMGQVALMAVSSAAYAMAEVSTRYRHLPGVVAAAQYPIRALGEMAAEDLDCPFETAHDDASFTKHFWSHVKEYADHDMQQIREHAKKVNDVMSQLWG